MKRHQTGITALGFLILASLFGILGLAGIKLTPLYAKSFRINTILTDIKTELDGSNPTGARIRSAVMKRLDIEGIRLNPEAVRITRAGPGYAVNIDYDNRAHFIHDVWLVVEAKKRIEISR